MPPGNTDGAGRLGHRLRSAPFSWELAHLRTYVLADIDVHLIELQECKVKEDLERPESSIASSRLSPDSRTTSLERHLSAFGAKEKLGLTEVRKTGSAGNAL
jgi:hypothetical protein